MASAPSSTATAHRQALLLGNHAIARGAWEAGVTVAAGYPGTPSTEILEALARYDDVYVEWSTNEKVALDLAVGAAFGGARALVTTKHVGLNVAADTLMVLGYTGVPAGCVIVTADDPGMHSSQNEQDNRLYARFAGLPMLEPADPAEARAFTIAAFDLSEAFEVPVLLRTTTRVNHGCSLVPLGERRARPAAGFRRDPARLVMLPAYARARHPVLLERLTRLAAAADASPLNVTELRDRRVGVVTSGAAYHYVREVLPAASVFKLGFSYPLPMARLRAFAASVDRLLVVEELEPLVEDALRAAGIAVEGKAFFPRTGELTPDVVREGFVRAGLLDAPVPDRPPGPQAPRPPVLCPGCPHTVPFLALRRLGAVVAGDIGCYTLAALEPLAAMDTCLAMGSSIGVALGLARSGGAPGPVVAAIGDSTFLHAGLPALIDAVYNQTPITVVILDNGTTAMTGGQPHPATGQTIRGAPAPRVDLAALCRAVGVESVQVVDPYDVGATYRALEAALAAPGPAVVITNRPCVESPAKVRTLPLAVRADACTACQACMALGCPAIVWVPQWYEGRPKVDIDPALCMGCAVCAQLCPPGAIVLAAAAARAAPRPDGVHPDGATGPAGGDA
ncbi:MAG: indolepyruvate ferredoxin oxidoreductase subunit alpha [Firmicutes bacterium]|nr:indolepyruvate ferredoxin oxidoreductase subunit alpha [Bacillota bacterium]